jgi:predicted phosphoribosyltransferase
MGAKYPNRSGAGQVIGELLKEQNFHSSPLILAIPNGGLAVALPIARVLNADLDLLIVRKLQIPHNPEAGFGAITSLGTVILNQPLVDRIGLTEVDIQQVIRKTQGQIDQRKIAYEGLVGLFSPENRIVVLVDDGLASGYTMLAAIQSVQQLSPQRIIVAVPTASASAIAKVQSIADELICPNVGTGYVFAVAEAYQKWYDVSEEEVIEQLREFRRKQEL